MDNTFIVKIQSKKYFCQEKQKLYLKDPKSDIFLLFQDYILPLHHDRVKQINHFNQNFLPDKRVYLIEGNYSYQLLVKVFSYFYGFVVELYTMQEILDLYTIIENLGIQVLKDQIQIELSHNFQKYQFFSLLQVAQEYNFIDLQNKCWKQLYRQQFQQTTYHIVGLLGCSPHLFEEIMCKMSYHYTANNNKCVIKETLIQKMIDIYCEINFDTRQHEGQQFQKLKRFLNSARKFQQEKNEDDEIGIRPKSRSLQCPPVIGHRLKSPFFKSVSLLESKCKNSSVPKNISELNSTSHDQVESRLLFESGCIKSHKKKERQQAYSPIKQLKQSKTYIT